jgi:hypothetical protein
MTLFQVQNPEYVDICDLSTAPLNELDFIVQHLNELVGKDGYKLTGCRLYVRKDKFENEVSNYVKNLRKDK